MNNDKIYENDRTIINNGTVETNNPGCTVTENNGTVNTNNGTVTENYGTVDTNSGTVETNNGTVTENYGTVNHNFGNVNVNYGRGTVCNEGGTVGLNYGTVYERYPVQMGGEPSADDEFADAEVVMINGAKWIRVTKYDVIMSGLFSWLSEAEQEEFWLNRGFANSILEAPQGGTVSLDLTSGIDRLQGAVLQAMLARPDVTVQLLLPHGRTAAVSSAAAAQYADRDNVAIDKLIG